MAYDTTSVDHPTTAAAGTITDEAATQPSGDRDPDMSPHTPLYTQEGNQYQGSLNVTGGTVNQGNFMATSESDSPFYTRGAACFRSRIMYVDFYQPDAYDPYNRRVLEWLSPLTFEDKQVDVYGGCQPEYWTWLFQEVKFKDWSRGRKGDLLFCPGMAGTGKIAFAAVVTEHMRLIKKSASSEIGVACLYFDYYESREMQTPNNMISSLTRQLIKQSPQLHKSVRAVYEDTNCGSATRTYKHNIDMLKGVVSQFSSTYIVIDALDECSEVDTPHNDKETKRFVSALKDEIRLYTTVLVTCRTNDYLKGKFDEMPSLNIRARNEDLVHYIKTRTNNGTDLGDRVHHNEHPDLESRIVQKIVDASDGMCNFLLAKLQLDHLADQIKAADTCEALESTPRTLQERYEKAMFYFV